MQREGLRGVFRPFFCINEIGKLHVSCKMENKMQDGREMCSSMDTKKAARVPLIFCFLDCRLHTGTTSAAYSFHKRAFALRTRACRGR